MRGASASNPASTDRDSSNCTHATLLYTGSDGLTNPEVVLSDNAQSWCTLRKSMIVEAHLALAGKQAQPCVQMALVSAPYILPGVDH